MQIIRRASQIEFIRYYLTCEIGKDREIWKRDENGAAELEIEVNSLTERRARDELIRLSTKRGNELRSRLDQNFWYLVTLRSSELRLPLINNQVNPFLQRVSHNLEGFTSLMREYPDNGDLKEFRDEGRKIPHEKLIVIQESSSDFRIMDGSHRAVVMCLRGKDHFDCFLTRSKTFNF